MHAVKDSKMDMRKISEANSKDPKEVDTRIYPMYPRGLAVQGGLLIYPMLYAGRQWCRAGWKYWITPYYWIEILNIILGWMSIYF